MPDKFPMDNLPGKCALENNLTLWYLQESAGNLAGFRKQAA
jgi:hypothetical protein